MTMTTRISSLPSEETIRGITQEITSSFMDMPGGLLPALQAVQSRFGYIPDEAVPVLGALLQRSRAEIQGVISFYPHLRSRAPGRHIVQVCRAEACQAMQGEALVSHISQQLDTEIETTRADGAVTLESVYCLGLCAQAPALMLDGHPHARMTPQRFDDLLEEMGASS